MSNLLPTGSPHLRVPRAGKYSLKTSISTQIGLALQVLGDPLAVGQQGSDFGVIWCQEPHFLGPSVCPVARDKPGIWGQSEKQANATSSVIKAGIKVGFWGPGLGLKTGFGGGIKTGFWGSGLELKLGFGAWGWD